MSCQCKIESGLLKLFSTDFIYIYFPNLGPASLGVEIQFSAIGDSATFTCNAVNVPSQSFTWMVRKGAKTEKIVSDSHYAISSSGTGSSELRITNVSAVDEGYYICNATINELNEARGFLQVLQGIFSFSSQIKEYDVVDFCRRIDSGRIYRLYGPIELSRKNIPNEFIPVYSRNHSYPRSCELPIDLKFQICFPGA